MVDVLKKSGKKESFDQNKVVNSIQKAVLDSGATIDSKKNTIDIVVKDVLVLINDSKVIESESIRLRILKTLSELAPRVAIAWREFDKNLRN